MYGNKIGPGLGNSTLFTLFQISSLYTFIDCYRKMKFGLASLTFTIWIVLRLGGHFPFPVYSLETWFRPLLEPGVSLSLYCKAHSLGIILNVGPYQP